MPIALTSLNRDAVPDSTTLEVSRAVQHLLTGARPDTHRYAQVDGIYVATAPWGDDTLTIYMWRRGMGSVRETIEPTAAVDRLTDILNLMLLGLSPSDHST